MIDCRIIALHMHSYMIDPSILIDYPSSLLLFFFHSESINDSIISIRISSALYPMILISNHTLTYPRPSDIPEPPH